MAPCGANHAACYRDAQRSFLTKSRQFLDDFRSLGSRRSAGASVTPTSRRTLCERSPQASPASQAPVAGVVRGRRSPTGPRVGVVVMRDGSHVVVDPALHLEVLGDDRSECVQQLDPDLLRGIRVVLLPDHHRHGARLALGHPAQVVLVEPLGGPRRLAQLARRVSRRSVIGVVSASMAARTSAT